MEKNLVNHNLDIPFKEFMAGQIIDPVQFNDDMAEIEEKVNEIIGKHNSLNNSAREHIVNKDNPHETTAHQVGTYTGEEIDGFVNDIKDGGLNPKSIKNEVLADNCVDSRTIANHTITASKVDSLFGGQIDISKNTDITDRYTKEEVNNLIKEKVGEGAYSKEEIDLKFQEVQAGQIVDKTIGVDKLKDDVGTLLDISANKSITDRYTKEEVDVLIRENGLPRDWGGLEEIVEKQKYGYLPVANVMTADEFIAPSTPVLDIDVREVVGARGGYDNLNKRFGNVDLQLEQIDNKEIISIMDYGAIGDKVNDDTNAIKTTLKKGRYITAKGEKHYVVSDIIEIPEHVTLDFNNAYVTFMGVNACFKLSKSSSLKNVRVNIPSGLVLSKSVIYIDGNDVFNVGWSHTPNIENITINQESTGEGDISYRENIGIWLNANQNTTNVPCVISGVKVQSVKATLLKHVIYQSVCDKPDNTINVYITSNTFRDIFAYNCKCFIKDEILSGATSKSSVGSCVYDNLHFQPADNKETCYIDLSGAGNIVTNALFWDNSRPSNSTDQIIIRGSYNCISGAVIPPYKSSYVNITGSYNFYQGFTYGIPTQYFGGKYISSRGYQKEWKNTLLPISYTYNKSIKNVNSGLIDGSNDVVAIELPLTYGDLGTGLTKITMSSLGTCKATTEVRRFWVGYGSENYYCGGSSPSVYSTDYKCNIEYVIRKYNEGYADIVVNVLFILGSGATIVNKVKSERKYNITNDMAINPRLLIGSTSDSNMTQLYHDIKIDFNE